MVFHHSAMRFVALKAHLCLDEDALASSDTEELSLDVIEGILFKNILSSRHPHSHPFENVLPNLGIK